MYIVIKITKKILTFKIDKCRCSLDHIDSQLDNKIIVQKTDVPNHGKCQGDQRPFIIIL